jgi:hypothetical protein
LNARAFDDVAVAFSAVGYRLAGQTEFVELSLVDDGRNGDKEPGDGYFGAILPPLPAGATVEYYLRVVDIEGQVGTSPDDPSDTSSLHTVVVPAINPTFRITEIMAQNSTGMLDEYGEYEDWLEILNTSAQPASLQGLALSKDYYNEAEAWPFPDLIVQGGQRAIVFCDSAIFQGPLHATFGLSRAGGRVYLIRTNDWAIIDSLSYGWLPTDTSCGVLATATEAGLLGWPTPGEENVRLPQLQPGEGLRLFSRLLQRAPNAHFLALRWFGETNRVYRTYWSEGLNSWHAATNDPTALGTGLFQWIDPDQTAPQRFYKVVIQP